LITHTTKTLQTEIMKVESVICDKCHRKIEDYENYININHQFGYGTVEDLNRWEFQICEDCLIECVNDCKIEYRKDEFFDEDDDE